MRYFTGPLIPAQAATLDPDTGVEVAPATPNTIGVGSPGEAYELPPGARLYYTYDVDGMTPLEGTDTVLLKVEGVSLQEGWTEVSPETAQSLFPEAF